MSGDMDHMSDDGLMEVDSGDLQTEQAVDVHSGDHQTEQAASQDRCGTCLQPYDEVHVQKTNSLCGHSFGCGTVCPTCKVNAVDMHPTCTPMSRDLTSPPPMSRRGSTSQGNVGGTGSGEKATNTAVAEAQAQTQAVTRPMSAAAATTSLSANVQVKCMNGTKCDLYVQDLNTCTVKKVKEEVQKNSGIHPERQHLLHQGRTMDDKRTLHSYNVKDGGVIQMGSKCYGG